MKKQQELPVFTFPARVRFGRTEIVVVVGDVLDQDAAGIVFPANRRGLMGAITSPGLVSLRSLGGSALEREAMARSPLELGGAIVTDAPGLESRGVEKVIHAAIHPALGEPARIEDVRRATAAIMLAANQSRLRTIAMPLLGIESGAGRVSPESFIDATIEEMVASLRRSTLRIDRITLAARFSNQATLAMNALSRARDRSWTRLD